MNSKNSRGKKRDPTNPQVKTGFERKVDSQNNPNSK
jgi:hypothetical protein